MKVWLVGSWGRMGCDQQWWVSIQVVTCGSNGVVGVIGCPKRWLVVAIRWKSFTEMWIIGCFATYLLCTKSPVQRCTPPSCATRCVVRSGGSSAQPWPSVAKGFVNVSYNKPALVDGNIYRELWLETVRTIKNLKIPSWVMGIWSSVRAMMIF